MSSIFADFGHLDYIPRLEKFLPKFYQRFLHIFLNADPEDGHGISVDKFAVFSVEHNEDGKFEFKLEDLTHGFPLLRLEFPRATTPDEFASEVISRILLMKANGMNFRRIPICICARQELKEGEKMCSLCQEDASFYNEVCPICLDHELQVHVWVETSCKHIFHKHCFEKCSNSCPICRADVETDNRIL